MRDTPRTNAETFDYVIRGDAVAERAYYPDGYGDCVDVDFARQLETELIEANRTISLQHDLMRNAEERGIAKATAELEQAKEQLRVAREALIKASKCRLFYADSMDINNFTTDLVLEAIDFTQPKPSADSPEGADPVKAETFPA